MRTLLLQEIAYLLRPQLDVGGKFFLITIRHGPYVRDPIGIIFWMEGTDGGTD